MATAVIQWQMGYGSWEDVCAVDLENYSCPDSDDGLHDWGGFDRSLCFCVPEGVMHTYCIDCGKISDTHGVEH